MYSLLDDPCAWEQRKWSETHSDRQDEAIAAAAGLDFVHFMPSITAVYSSQLSTSSSEVLTADAAAGSPSQTGCAPTCLLVCAFRFC